MYHGHCLSPLPMKKEKIILSFIATLIGIVVALVAFYFYQTTKKVNPNEVKKITIENPTPTPSSSIFISVERPKDEDVVDEKSLTISGKTIPNAKIVILTQSDEVGGIAAGNGNFSTDVNLEEGENIIEINAFSPNGERAKTKITVTYSTESF